jgi:hypothetical protein
VPAVAVSEGEERVNAGAAIAVAGNIDVITPELAEFVVVAPATVKKLAVTPESVYPDVGVKVIVAV